MQNISKQMFFFAKSIGNSFNLINLTKYTNLYSLNLPPNIMKVLGCIGAGSFGKVLKVQLGSQILAVKKIALTLDKIDEVQDLINLQKQVTLMSDCFYHPNIVRCYSSFRNQDHFYILMEYVGYRTLDDLSVPLNNQKQIVNLIIQLSLGLKHLKDKKVVHRDIKPTNIIISDKGLLKIVDFGISRIIQYDNQAKTVLGTPFYTAPEIIQQTNYGFAVDIWSLGIILFQMTHGSLPFLANNMQQLKNKIKFQIPTVKKQLHPDIRLIIRGCLAKSAENRLTVEQILKVPLIRDQMAEQLESTARYF